MKYKIESKINIFSKVVDLIFITIAIVITYFSLKTGVAFSKKSYTIFIILLVAFNTWIFIRDFICYKSMKITHFEIIFYYPILRKEIRVKKSSILKIEFIENEHIYRTNIYYDRVRIITERKKYIISSKDYRNFWSILDKIGATLTKRKIKRDKGGN